MQIKEKTLLGKKSFLVDRHLSRKRAIKMLTGPRPEDDVKPPETFCIRDSDSEVAQSCPTLCDPMDCIAHHAPLSMGFSRQEYWSGLPFPSSGDLPDPGIEPRSPALQADALTSEPPGKPFVYGKVCKKKAWSQ